MDAENGGLSPPLLDEFHEVERQVLEALGREDALHKEAGAEGHLHVKNEENLDIQDELEGLYTEATTPVNPGFKNERCVSHNHHNEYVLSVPCEQYTYR